MLVAVKSNLRTAAAAQHSVADALRISLRGGAVSGILVVGLSLIGVFAMFVAYGGFAHPEQAPFTIFGFFFFQAEDGIRDGRVTGVQTCALPISRIESSSPTRCRGTPSSRVCPVNRVRNRNNVSGR